MRGKEWQEGLQCAAKAADIAIACNGTDFDDLATRQQQLMMTWRGMEASPATVM